MAMDGDTCGDELLAAFGALSDAEKADPLTLYRTLCGVLIDHIAANATIDVDVASVGGVTSGSEESGSGTGTGSIS